MPDDIEIVNQNQLHAVELDDDGNEMDHTIPININATEGGSAQIEEQTSDEQVKSKWWQTIWLKIIEIIQLILSSI